MVLVQWGDMVVNEGELYSLFVQVVFISGDCILEEN